jgi:hypothetical protein
MGAVFRLSMFDWLSEETYCCHVAAQVSLVGLASSACPASARCCVPWEDPEKGRDALAPSFKNFTLPISFHT